MKFLNVSKEGVRISVFVQPRSSRCKIVGIHDDALKIALTAPPVDGAANEALIEFFSDFFKLRKNQIEIVSGLTGRRKIIALSGVSIQQAEERLADVTK